jgi:chromate transporter
MAPIGLKDLFVIFLKAGLAFGGGLGILAVLEGELVTKRKALTRAEFLTAYALGRLVPSGTMTALAAAFGTRFAGAPGSVVALAAMTLPAFTLSVIFSATYVALSGTAFLDVVPLTILPAALAFIAAAALRLGRDITVPSVEALLATAAFIGAFVFRLSPALLLLAGGVTSVIVLSFGQRQETAA